MAFTKINAAGIGTTERVTVDGLTVINNLSVGGTVSIAGTLTYEDVTNVDAVGLITARDGIFVSAGSSIGIGTAAPADILHLRSTGPILKVDATNNASGLRIDVLGQTGGANNQLFRVQRDGTTKLQLNDDGDLVITGNDNAELKLKAGTAAGEDKVGFLNSDGTAKGNISYDTVNNSLAFKLGGVAASNEKVRIDSNGRVGFGVTDPESRLTVAATNGTTQIELKRSNSNATGTVGALNFTASDGHSVANISAIGDGDNEGAHLVFRTTSAAGEHSPFGGSTIERFRITSSGDVGIGTTNPNNILHIENGVNSTIAFGNNAHGYKIKAHVNDTADYGLRFQDEDGVDLYRMHSSTATSSANSHLFYTAGSERLRIDSSGNIGISTESPTGKLSVGKVGAYLNRDGITVTNPHSSGLKNGVFVLNESGYNSTASYRAAAFKAVGASGIAVGVSTDQGSNGLGGTLNYNVNFDGKTTQAGSITANGSFYHEESGETNGGDTQDKTIEFNRRGIFLMLISYSLGTTTTDINRNVYSLGLFVSRSNGATWIPVQQNLNSTHVGNLTISDASARGKLRVQKSAGTDDRQCAFRIDVLSSADVAITVTDT